jgi:hypothetical protein
MTRIFSKLLALLAVALALSLTVHKLILDKDDPYWCHALGSSLALEKAQTGVTDRMIETFQLFDRSAVGVESGVIVIVTVLAG